LTISFNYDRTYAPCCSIAATLNILLNLDLPFGKGKRWGSNAPADKVIGPRTLSGVLHCASGIPFGVIDLKACATGWPSRQRGARWIAADDLWHRRIIEKNTPTIGTFGTNSSQGGVPTLVAIRQGIAQFRYPTFEDNSHGGGANRDYSGKVDLALPRGRRSQSGYPRVRRQWSTPFNPFRCSAGTSVFGWNNEAKPLMCSAQQYLAVSASSVNSQRYLQMGLRSTSRLTVEGWGRNLIVRGSGR